MMKLELLKANAKKLSKKIPVSPDACLCRNGYVQAGQSYLT
jgi:hypothetical protein